jgi:radical SAM-linked protein
MMAGTQPASAAHAARPGVAGAFRVAFEAAVTGDLRFLAHHDELRMLERALVRAGWPLAYSQGFNPRPHLSVPLPRNVGTAADSQLALVDLRAPRCADELAVSLAAALPADYRLVRLSAPAPRRVPHAQTACYELELEAADAAELGPRIEELSARPTVVVQRDYGPGRASRPIDIRPYIEQLQLEGGRLRIVLRCNQQRTARPSEVITELGLRAAAYSGRLRRSEVQWDMELFGPESGPAARERKCFDDQETLSKKISGEEDHAAVNEKVRHGAGGDVGHSHAD